MIGNSIRNNHGRRGVALPLVLFCILLAMILGIALTKTILLHHGQAQLTDQQHQSLWLVESAVQRATFNLRKSPEYRGETWQIPAATLGGSDDGKVTIRVNPDSGATAGWKVRVEATYPDHPLHRVVQQRAVIVPRS